MDDSERKDISEAIMTIASSSTVGTIGVVGLCNELVSAGILTKEAVARIGAFMAHSVIASAPTPAANNHLIQMINDHFGPIKSGNAKSSH